MNSVSHGSRKLPVGQKIILSREIVKAPKEKLIMDILSLHPEQRYDLREEADTIYSMFKDLYAKMGYEPRLLSRSCEDGGTVTSVLVPWNTCGLTQSTVLGVATLTYLPYCFFNLLMPFVSITVATIGWGIRRPVVSASSALSSGPKPSADFSENQI